MSPSRTSPASRPVTRSAAQQRWRRRTGRTPTARVPLVALGRVLETGDARTVVEITALVGVETADDARAAYRHLALEVEEPVA